MSALTVLTNALVVTPLGALDGSVAIEGGRIVDVAARRYADGLDLHGALLMPGIIDVHTDYLEKEISPRPGAEVPLEMALHVMDLRALTCGLTTVLSGARVSPERSGSAGSWHGDGLRLARELHRLAGSMRARHLVHVRWDTRYDPSLRTWPTFCRSRESATWFSTIACRGCGNFAISTRSFAKKRWPTT